MQNAETYKAQLEQLIATGTYTETTSAEIQANNQAIESSAALAGQVLTLAEAYAVLSRTKAAAFASTPYEGDIAVQEHEVFANTYAGTTLSFDYSNIQAQMESLQEKIKQEIGGTYDYITDETGKIIGLGEFQAELDANGNLLNSNNYAAWGGVVSYLESVQTAVETGADISEAFGDVYDDLGSGGGSDALENILKALDAIVDKEYEAMKVWDSINQKSLGDTEYYDKKATTLANLLAYYTKMAEQYKDSDQEKYLDYLQKQMDIEKQIANLDDEQVEDKINLLKTQKASLAALIAAQKELIATSDTEQENAERAEELNELYEERFELLKEIAEFEQESADYALEYLSGTAYSDASMYDKYVKYKKESI